MFVNKIEISIIKPMKTSMSKTGTFLFLSFFILIGIYFILMGVFPVEIKINSLNNKATAQIERHSMLPPFNKVNIVIPHLKQALIGTSKSSKGGTTYRVELETFNGNKFPVTTYYSSGYLSKEKLKNKINESIKTGIDIEYTLRQTFMMIFGLFFILIPLIIMFITFYKQDNDKQKTETKPIDEQDKYEKINDLIIK